ncbi:MAG: SMP-30/gluconolactonase/LRE family protein [Gammaproteobacteria bacterium]
MLQRILIIFLLNTVFAAQGDEEIQVLDAPENAYWHADSQSWFVSNLGGGLSLEKDGYGWVARFDKLGNIISPRWVDKLDAPTGMGAHHGHLFVADRGRVHEIDIESGKILRDIALPDSEFVNDVAVTPGGRVFVSDTAKNRIYEVADGQATIWLESPSLQSPNGLWVQGNSIVVATWGPMTDLATFATEHAGTLLRVDINSKSITPVGEGKPIANFDGLVAVGNTFYATDWTGGRLLRIIEQGAVRVVMSGFNQLADLGYDPQSNRLGLPIMKDNRFILLSLDR